MANHSDFPAHIEWAQEASQVMKMLVSMDRTASGPVAQMLRTLFPDGYKDMIRHAERLTGAQRAETNKGGKEPDEQG